MLSFYAKCCVTCFGCAGILYFSWQLSKLLWHLLRPAKDLYQYGTWSVVTGCTSGIGEAIAYQLAKKGQNLLLIGRTETKLLAVAAAINNKYPLIQIEIMCIDLAQFNDQQQREYSMKLEKRDVGILINNAGLSYKHMAYFNEVDQQTIENIMLVNNMSATILMQRTIAYFLVRKKKNGKKGCIINMSSAAAIFPMELHCVYGGSKAFLNKISSDLSLEYSKKGIMIQAQIPLFVCSKMSRIRKPSFSTPSAEDFAIASVDQIGYNGLVSPYAVHAVILFVAHFLPTFVVEYMLGSLHHSLRKRALRKYSNKNK